MIYTEKRLFFNLSYFILEFKLKKIQLSTEYCKFYTHVHVNIQNIKLLNHWSLGTCKENLNKKIHMFLLNVTQMKFKHEIPVK